MQCQLKICVPPVGRRYSQFVASTDPAGRVLGALAERDTVPMVDTVVCGAVAQQLVLAIGASAQPESASNPVATIIESPLICKVEMSFLGTLGVRLVRTEASNIAGLRRCRSGHLCCCFGPMLGGPVGP